MRSVRVWENRLMWALAGLLAGVTFAVYFSAPRGIGAQTVLPLDDAYIHLQYARQIASGQPFTYNPGEAPTSGATSLLYPFLLAVGALLGLRDVSLGVWAMILGIAAFGVSIILTYRTARLYAPVGYAAVVAFAFGTSGSFAWHAMSGMETMLATCFALALLYGVASLRRGWVVWTAVLLAVIRPEGAVGALLASGWLAWQWWAGRKRADEVKKGAPWGVPLLMILLPIMATGVQPLLNLVVTGTLAATGGQAKSLFNAVAPMDVIAGRIVENFTRMWREWLLPDVRYGVVVIPLLALFAVVVGVVRERYGPSLQPREKMKDTRSIRPVVIALFVVLWMVGTAALISTLDTAFWHFKRYQIPMMALLFPLAAWGGAELEVLFRRRWRVAVRLGIAVAVGVSIVVGITQQSHWVAVYALNVGYVNAQPRAMAIWLAENAPSDAVIAVHDVGMMRYLGGRTTFDMVGLTTRGAAASWRQGPGAVGELLVRARPDLIAAYGEGHGLGLNYLQETDLYAETLASYRVWLNGEDNVALAAATQGIYRPDWTTSDRADLPRQASLRPYLDLPGMALIDTIDVADLADEAAHDYAWRSAGAQAGFPTEFFQFDGLDCGTDCTLADGGRRINAEESFTIRAQPGQALLLVTRVQAAHPGELDVYTDDVLVGTRVLPFLPGQWYELMTLIPPEAVDGATRIRIMPRLPEGDYMPYQHWIYQSNQPLTFASSTEAALATYQDGRFSLVRVNVAPGGGRLDVTLHWMNGQPGEPQAEGDYLAFVHLYGDLGAPPVAQMDRRPANGTLPPGNWPPGMLIDTFMLDLSSMPPGRYRVAVGFYDPYSFARLQPTLAPDAPPEYEAAPDGRLWVGELTLDDGQ